VKIGAEPKKVMWLAGLIVTAGLVYYFESSDSASPAAAPARRAAAAIDTVVSAPATRKSNKTERRRETNASLIKEWKPRLGFQNPEERPDPATVDPRLRMDLLAKVQSVEAGLPGRNPFTFGAAPAPEKKLPPAPPVIHTTEAKPPATAPPGPPPPPPTPTAPPMTFKYYGYKVSKTDGHKAAFLLDGDDILIAGENDTLKRRYRVVKIGINSITIEDTQFKSTQTLPMLEGLPG
jgi:hypothetical protein